MWCARLDSWPNGQSGRHPHPLQWVSDYIEFITSQLQQAQPSPRKVVLVGISEGAYVAVKVARASDDHTLVDGRTNYRKSFFEELTRRLER